MSPRRSRAGLSAHPLATLTIATLIAATGCSPVGGETSFAVCGQTLYTAPDMPVPYTVSAATTSIHTTGVVLLRFAAGCSHGVDVTVIPAATEVVSRAKADDGRTVAMVLKLDRLSVQLTIVDPDGVGHYVWIFDEPTPSPSQSAPSSPAVRT